MREPELQFPPFRPKWWLRGPHAQTIGSVYYPYRLPEQKTIEHVVELEDGDRLVLHENCVPASRQEPLVAPYLHPDPTGRVIILVHGLGGSHRSLHVARLAYKLAAHGWTCLRMDQRGCGSGLTLAKRPTHAGRSEDLAAVVRFVQSRWPQRPITLIGFSLGGNVLLKLLAEYGSQPPAELDSAVAVAPPIDLATCADNLQQGSNWFYDRIFLRALNRLVQERRDRVDGCADIQLRSAPTSLLDFDNRYTAPLAGFRDAQEYYQECSAARRLSSICVKTWIITSRDDPLVPFRIFTDVHLGSGTALHATTHGGHLGFIEQNGKESDPFWLDWRLMEIIASLANS